MLIVPRVTVIIIIVLLWLKRDWAGRMPKYRHVFWHHASQRWRAVLSRRMVGKKSVQQVQSFRTQQEAVKAVVKKMQCTVEDLRPSPQKTMEKNLHPSLYHGVFHDNRPAGKKKWIAQAYNKKKGRWVAVYLGRFHSQLEAAKKIAKHKRCLVKDLRRNKKQVYTTVHGIQAAKARFKIMLGVCVKKVYAVPADYEISKWVAKDAEHQKMFKDEVGTEECSISLKYGGPKLDLLTAWKKMKPQKHYEKLAAKMRMQHQKNQTIKRENATKMNDMRAGRRLRLIGALQEVAKKMHGTDLSLWVKNCGRFVSKQQGPVIFLGRTCVIRKVKDSEQVQKKDLLNFQKAGGQGHYVLNDTMDAAMHRKIDELLQRADALKGKSWRQVYNMHCHRSKNKGYGELWKNRGLMANILWSRKPPKTYKEELCKMDTDRYPHVFPDQYQWVKKFAGCTKAKKKKTMGNLFKEVGYTGRECMPQDFSMWACLCGDKAFTQVSVMRLKKLVPHMQKELIAYRKKNKMWPHPAVLLKEAQDAEQAENS